MDLPPPGAPTERLEPPPGPPPAPPRRGALPWIVAGLGGLVLLMVCALAGLLVAFPESRARALALVGIASAPPPPDSPKDPNPPAITRPLAIDETFDQPSPRWDQSGGRVVDGAYELRIDIPHYDGYGLYLGPASDDTFNASAIDDFDIAVDVQQTAGSPVSEYGVRFRQTGPGDHLMFSISGTGHYRLVRVKGAEYQAIVPWTFDRRIKTGLNAVNRLRVVAENADITAYINGAQVLKARDDVDTGGQLTLGLTTYDQGGLVVRFSTIEGRAGRVDLREDFKDPAKARWSVGGSQITGGGYEVEAGSGVQTWQQPLPTGSSRVGNFELEVTAELVSGDTNAAYGVMFGDDGNFNYYSLLIFPQGGLGLFQRKGGQTNTIVPITPLSQVRQGTGAANTLLVEVKGNAMTISLNGQQLGEIQSDAPIQGMAGMTVLGSASGPAKARFDSFKLKELP